MVGQLAAGQTRLLRWRQSVCRITNNRDDLPHDITAVTAGDIFEQIAHRGAD
jgi:hypothetical protein